ncbi:MAG: alpha/beta fold hydrolase [Pseudonocardiaceae bacterium]
MDMSVSQRVVLSDGAVLWTESTVEPGGTGLVLVHGGPGMWDYLHPVATMLNGAVSTHRYDQRGCGRSAPNTDYRLARFVADLDELREHFGYEQWYVFGHSFGAALSLAYASAHPVRVTGLIYCSGVGLDWSSHRATYRARVRARLTDAQAARRDELQERDRSWEEEVEWRVLCWLPGYADRAQAPTLARQVAATALPLNLDCNTAINAETRRRSLAEERAECDRVTAPVLVIHGSADPRPLDGAHTLVEAIPDADLKVIRGAGHWPWQEQPRHTQALLRDFITRVGPNVASDQPASCGVDFNNS